MLAFHKNNTKGAFSFSQKTKLSCFQISQRLATDYTASISRDWLIIDYLRQSKCLYMYSVAGPFDYH